MMKFTLTALEQHIVTQFTLNRMAQKGGMSAYQSRGHTNLNKVSEDIKNGACAEIAVYNMFRRGVGDDMITVPDFKIYDKRSKDFLGDLTLKGEPVHIKSVTAQAERSRGASWLFQKEDRLFKSPSVQEMIVTVITNFPHATIHGIFLAKEISEKGLLRDPLYAKFIGVKDALYLEDLEQATNFLTN